MVRTQRAMPLAIIAPEPDGKGGRMSSGFWGAPWVFKRRDRGRDLHFVCVFSVEDAHLGRPGNHRELAELASFLLGSLPCRVRPYRP